MIRINLLPIRAEKRRENLRQQILMVVGFFLVVIAVVGSIHFTISRQVDSVNQNIGARKREVARLDKIIKEVKNFDKKKRDLKEKIDIISKLEERQRGPSRVLHEVAKVIPDKMWINKFKDASGKMSMSGIALDNQTIAKFMRSLEESPWFSGVKLEYTRLTTKGGAPLTTFSLMASINYQRKTG